MGVNKTKAESVERKTVKVVLAKDHEDSGIKYEAGSTLEVDEITAAWLEQNKVGTRATE